MDPYTENTKSWLDERFSKHTPEGIYISHQPIYGYLRGNCDPGDYITCYNRIYNSLCALKTLDDCKTMLDVGAAEGFTSHMAREILGMEVECCDLSSEACKRANEIFNIKSKQADIHQLPYEDASFDVVLCNETIEHIPDPQIGVMELIRVARKAVVITVPHEPEQKIEELRHSGEPHAHINCFNLESFDRIARDRNCKVAFRKAFQHESTSRLGRTLIWPLKSHSTNSRMPASVYWIYQRCALLLRSILGSRLPEYAIRKDFLLHDNDISDFGCMLFVITKDMTRNITDLNPVKIRDIITRSVPPHQIKSTGY